MIFMAADNNLEGATSVDINELETVGSTKDVNFVVQLDRSGQYSEGSELTWGGTRRFFITKDQNPLKMTSPQVQDIGEVDMAAPQSLVDFVTWSKKNFPAEKYALIFWNHGTGWKEVRPSIMGAPGATFNNSSGMIHFNISYDDTSASSMDIPTLHEALAEVAKVLEQPLDLVGYDACLMQMVEVAFAASPFAKYQVASPDREPERGWPYDAIATALTKHPQMAGFEFGQAIVSTYKASYTMGSQGNTAVVLSLLDLANLDTFRTSFNAFCQVARAEMISINEIERARQDSLIYVYEDYIDLGHFLRLLKKYAAANTKLTAAAQELLTTLYKPGSKKSLVVACGADGKQFENSSGISIFFPTRDGFKTYRNRYRLLNFCRETEWFDVLQDLGSPNIAYPKLEEIHLIDENRDGRITKGERVQIRIKATNFGKKAATDLRFSASTKSKNLTQQSFDVVLKSPPAPGKSATLDGVTFQVREDAPENVEVVLNCQLSGKNLPVSTRSISFFIKPPFTSHSPVLLVMTDGFSPASPVLQNMLQESKIPFDVWDRILDGEMKPEVLRRYLDGWILISSQDSSDQQKLTESEITALTGFLQTGGRCVLTGQDLAFSLREHRFLKDFCKAAFIQDDINVHVVQGKNGFCRDGALQIFAGDGANNQKWPDEIDPLSGAQVILTYNEAARDMAHDRDMNGPDLKPGSLSRGMKSSGTAGIKVIDGYRLMFFAFGLEALNSRQQRIEAIKAIQAFMDPSSANELRNLAVTARAHAPAAASAADEQLNRVDLLANLERSVVNRVVRETERNPQSLDQTWKYLQSLPQDARQPLTSLEKNLHSLLEFRRQHGTLMTP